MTTDKTFFLLINEARTLLNSTAIDGEVLTHEEFDLLHENVKLITYAGFLRHLLRRSLNHIQHNEKSVEPIHLSKAS